MSSLLPINNLSGHVKVIFLSSQSSDLRYIAFVGQYIFKTSLYSKCKVRKNKYWNSQIVHSFSGDNLFCHKTICLVLN